MKSGLQKSGMQKSGLDCFKDLHCFWTRTRFLHSWFLIKSFILAADVHSDFGASTTIFQGLGDTNSTIPEPSCSLRTHTSASQDNFIPRSDACAEEYAEVASKKCHQPTISQKSSLVEADNGNSPGLDTTSPQCINCFEKCKPMATLEVSVWVYYTCHCIKPYMFNLNNSMLVYRSNVGLQIYLLILLSMGCDAAMWSYLCLHNVCKRPTFVSNLLWPHIRIKAC